MDHHAYVFGAKYRQYRLHRWRGSKINGGDYSVSYSAFFTKKQIVLGKVNNLDRRRFIIQ